MDNIFLLVSIVLIQIIAIIVNMYLINVERKYCKNCEWWSEIGTIIFIILSFVPILGIVVPIGYSVDCLRHIIEAIKGDANG